MTSFTKMHGLANDFIVIDCTQQPINFNMNAIPLLANRHTGIGFDQLLVILPSQQADFFVKIYNADGSEAEQCGNGLRCIAKFIVDHHLSSQRQFQLETIAGIFPVTMQDNEHISILLNVPRVEPQRVSIAEHELSVVSIGNPHAITKVAAVDSVNADIVGSAISSNACFPHGANVGFMEVLNPHHIRLRTFERGAGETHACGSNACAAAVAGISQGWLSQPVTVEFRYGNLIIEWAGDNQPVKMTGPAVTVFTGEVPNLSI